jgi:hypothetical protein
LEKPGKGNPAFRTRNESFGQQPARPRRGLVRVRASPGRPIGCEMRFMDARGTRSYRRVLRPWLACPGGHFLPRFYYIVKVSGRGSGQAALPVTGIKGAARSSRWSRGVVLRGAGTIAVRRLAVQGCDSPASESAGLPGALKRVHPGPYPLPPGPCFRTLGEALGTFVR